MKQRSDFLPKAPHKLSPRSAEHLELFWKLCTSVPDIEYIDDFEPDTFDRDVYEYESYEDGHPALFNEEAYWKMPPSILSAFEFIDKVAPIFSGHQYIPLQPGLHHIMINLDDEVIPGFVDHDVICGESSFNPNATTFGYKAPSGSGIPNTITPETIKPETIKPETIKPKTTKPKTTKPETTKPNKPKSSPELEDAIFVAIDFEWGEKQTTTGGRKLHLREVGIAMLDTRDLRKNNVSKDVISTQHYRIVWDDKSYGNKFLFGESTNVTQAEAVTILKRLFYLDKGPSEEVRNIILVGHGVAWEVRVMLGLKIDLRKADDVIQIIDTNKLAVDVLGRTKRLKDVVSDLGMSGANFHNAGNDANYSLRAMLLLSIYGEDESKLEGAIKETVEMYRRIAQF
jgi:hypothetical protein